MKKPVSLLLALVCAVALTAPAFAAQPDAYRIYQSYVDKANSIKSMEYSAVQKLSLVIDGRSSEIMKRNAAVKTILTKDNKLQMEIKMKDSITEEISYNYLKDGYLYQKTVYGNYKTKLAAGNSFTLNAGINLGLTNEMLKDAKVEKVDEGTKITFQTKHDSIEGPFDYFLSSITSSDAKLTFTSMTTGIVIGDDGMLKSITSVYGASLTDGKQVLKFKITQTNKVKSVNSVDSIKFPSDLESYQLFRF